MYGLQAKLLSVVRKFKLSSPTDNPSCINNI